MKLGGRINTFTQNPLYTLDIDIHLKKHVKYRSRSPLCHTLTELLLMLIRIRRRFFTTPGHLSKKSHSKCKSTAFTQQRGWKKTLIRNSVTVPEFLSAVSLLPVIQSLWQCCWAESHLSASQSWEFQTTVTASNHFLFSHRHFYLDFVKIHSSHYMYCFRLMGREVLFFPISSQSFR